jgi:hypothetical protein
MFGFELAYIDPGSGSLIIQGAIASIVAAAVFFRGQIARLLPGRRGEGESEAATSSSTTTPTTPTTQTTSTPTSVDDAARGG